MAATNKWHKQMLTHIDAPEKICQSPSPSWLSRNRTSTCNLLDQFFSTNLRCGPPTMSRMRSNALLWSDHESIRPPKHKATCKAIQRKGNAVERHEQKLINNRVEGNYFTLYDGKFWGHHETRPYMGYGRPVCTGRRNEPDQERRVCGAPGESFHGYASAVSQ